MVKDFEESIRVIREERSNLISASAPLRERQRDIDSRKRDYWFFDSFGWGFLVMFGGGFLCLVIALWLGTVGWILSAIIIAAYVIARKVLYSGIEDHDLTVSSELATINARIAELNAEEAKLKHLQSH